MPPAAVLTIYNGKHCNVIKDYDETLFFKRMQDRRKKQA